jgi:hypothetical protein
MRALRDDGSVRTGLGKIEKKEKEYRWDHSPFAPLFVVPTGPWRYYYQRNCLSLLRCVEACRHDRTIRIRSLRSRR